MRLRALAVGLMLASGFAGLGYQIVWTQQSALWLGHEAAAMLAIVAAFFGGLGLGALWSGRWIDLSARPQRWYAACEAAIGLWGLALIWLMTPVSRLLLEWLGPQPSPWWHWTVAFGGTFVLLLPATAAMGATLPAMERIVADVRGHRLPAALLYAANTFGAVLGVIGTAFMLIPVLGLKATAVVCVTMNIACAGAAARMGAAGNADMAGARRSEARRTASGSPLFTLAVTGFLGIGYEVLVVRVLSQVAENTIFTFAILLAVYLVGTAIGAAAYARWAPANDAQLRNRLLRWQALACLLGVLVLVVAEPVKRTLMAAFGTSLASSLAVETMLGCAAFLLPTILMGALFSHLVVSARTAGESFGNALGVNTLAAALAPVLFGVIALPALGATLSLLIVAGGYLVLVSEWRSPLQLGAAASFAVLALWQPVLGLVAIPEGGRLLTHAQGVSANVSVIEDAAGIATLHINNRQQEGSSATLYSDARQALLPVLLQPTPKRVLFLGLGTGATARSAAIDAALRVDAVELLPEVIEASALFARLQHAPAQPGLHLLSADARRFVRSAGEPYDVIVADNFHPARSGSASLYTREHFAAVRARLSERGLFCQWLPLHQLDLDTARVIVATYLAEFPRAWAVLATNSLDTPVLGLVARRDGSAFDRASVIAALESHAAPAEAVDLDDDLSLLGSFIAGPASLTAFSTGALLNTDDHPVIAYLAPRITYAPESTPRARLLALLSESRIVPGELVGPTDSAWSRRLAAYWDARNRYLAVGSQVRPTGEVHDMLMQVRAPLIEILRISPDFRPAYDPLVRMALALAATDEREARGLLETLAALQPEWSAAREALAQLAPR
ncbi:MAG TPA: fused MFS/spermidine synthase [Steroidobacteraceae bacterium]|nr:fused MFS/spermidine synthase [Steroidobacteraceae bacterium]